MRIARELTNAGLPFMIIGGQAVLLYGFPRLTRDFDVTHKIFAGRPRDLEDAVTILAKNSDPDRDYIQKWLKEFDRTMATNDFSRRFAELSVQAGLSA